MGIFSSFTFHGVSSSNVSDFQILLSQSFKVVYVGDFPSQQGVAAFSWMVSGERYYSPFNKFQNECLFEELVILEYSDSQHHL